MKISPTAAILALCEARGLPIPEKEFAFAKPVRDWRFDLAWIDLKIALEIDGAVFAGGRHTRGKGYSDDCEKFAEAVCRGWAVLRVTTNQVNSGQCFGWIERLVGGRIRRKSK